jgi:DNA-binding NtrC family response regulator
VLRILVVEDDADVRRAVVVALTDAGHTITEVTDGAAAIERVSAATFDVVVTDVRMPKADGVAVFRHTRKVAPRTAVIMMTSFATVSNAVLALKEGAHDYLTKPFDVDELVIRVRMLEEKIALERALEEARAKLAGGDAQIVGQSPVMVSLFDKLAAVAPTDAAVLVTGESGTGKELIARRIHALSARRNEAFVAVNCASFPETLLEAELFGHERGAFTGAAKKRDGRFKAADHGTLFLDEIGEMPLSAQAKLLRVVQEGVIEPLGTNQPVKVDVRIVSATNRDLKAAIAEGRFRADLFYRLNVVGLHLPPLRDRAGDFPLLINHFLAKRLDGRKLPEISLKAWQALTHYPFPGNIRELAHAMEHAAILSRGKTIEMEHLPDDIVAVAKSASPNETVTPLAAVMKKAEREHLLKALAVAGGRKARAAELLGISRKNLWEKLRAHDLTSSDLDD